MRRWRIENLRERATAGDVISLIAAAATAIYPDDPDRSVQRAREVAAEYAVSEDLDIGGVVNAGQVLGIIGVERVAAGEVVVRDLAVATKIRRQGAGRALLDFIRDQLRPDLLWGYTWADAVEFYKRCGFSVREDGSLPSGQPRYAFALRRS